MRKMRGCRYLSGAHDFSIETGGVKVYPRLVAQSYASLPPDEPLRSGISQIDALTGDGLPRGSSTLIVGPAGTGKSSIATLYACAAAAAGENSSILLFDESVETHMIRSDGLGLDLAGARRAGRVRIDHFRSGGTQRRPVSASSRPAGRGGGRQGRGN